MELDETFADLDRAELKRLGQRSNGPGLARLAIQVPWLVASGWWLVTAADPISFALALGVHGLAQMTYFGPLHETAHRTAFESRPLNDAVGWLAGLVQFMAPNLMRAFHFEHHRHTHELEHDPELQGFELLARWPTGLVFWVNASGLPILLGRASWTVFAAVGVWPRVLWRVVMPFVTDKTRSGVVWHSRILVAMHVAIIAAGVLWLPTLWRLYAAAIVSHAALSLYVSAEHRGLAYTEEVLDCTRTFAGNRVVDFLMWNMPYHAEHHGWPGVPFHQLPALHERVADRLPHKGKRLLQLYLSRGT